MRIDTLVPGLTDPISGQPASKNVTVTARRFEAEHFGFVITVNRPDAGRCEYWALAKCAGVWCLELAVRRESKDVEEFDRMLCGGEPGAQLDCAAYRDQKQGDHRLTLYEADRLVGALYLSRQPVAVSRLGGRPVGAAG